MSKKSNKVLKRIVITLAILVIAFPLAAFGYVFSKLNAVYDPNADVGILGTNEHKFEEGITNVLFVGTDGRPGETSSRSDAMMILTIDNKNKNLKLTSLGRDSYVNAPGKGNIKLTESYAYGGINLLVETIEKNFELDIQNYAIVDFYSFMDIIDALGGVSVEVKQKEINELNKFIPETYKWNNSSNKGSIKYVKSAGEQKLNGYQALAFSRIRKNDSTMERDRRQREVIEGLMEGVKDLPLNRYSNLIDTILPYVKTNMKPTQIVGLATKALSIGKFDIDQMEFPIMDGVNGYNTKIDGKSVIVFDKNSLDTLHKFIFENIIPGK